MPWDAPTAPASPAVEPPVDDVVPYTDVDAAPYEDAPEPEAVPAQSQPQPAPAPAPMATDAIDDREDAFPAASGEERGTAVGSAGLTPEFADIASMLTAAFGQPLSVSVESAVTTSDEDAAEELSYEEAAEQDDGFTDEPMDDSEDDDNED